jgi:hypothetical protein
LQTLLIDELARVDQYTPAAAQTTPAATALATEVQAPEPLTDEELEILVARIALYPDELVALISAASLYPLQIIEADRFLAHIAAEGLDLFYLRVPVEAGFTGAGGD